MPCVYSLILAGKLFLALAVLLISPLYRNTAGYALLFRALDKMTYYPLSVP